MAQSDEQREDVRWTTILHWRSCGKDKAMARRMKTKTNGSLSALWRERLHGVSFVSYDQEATAEGGGGDMGGEVPLETLVGLWGEGRGGRRKESEDESKNRVRGRDLCPGDEQEDRSGGAAAISALTVAAAVERFLVIHFNALEAKGSGLSLPVAEESTGADGNGDQRRGRGRVSRVAKVSFVSELRPE
jgi:hypothetical protein